MKTSEPKTKITVQLQQELREAIVRSGVSHKRAAQALGVSRSALAQYLNGTALPSVETLARMVSLWNIQIKFDGNAMLQSTSSREIEPAVQQVLIEAMWKKLRIFLCHASEDKPRVRQLYTRLRDDGFKPWLDTEDLLPGQDWDEAIKVAVRQADVVLVCLSSRATQKSGYVHKEIAQALDAAEEKPEKTIFIVPIKFDQCAVPTRLSKWQWVDLRDDAGYDKLVLALRHRSEQLGHDVSMLNRRIRSRVIERFANSGSFRSAEDNARELYRLEPFSAEEINKILDAAAENGQIWYAKDIPAILEELVSNYAHLADPEITKRYMEAIKHR